MENELHAAAQQGRHMHVKAYELLMVMLYNAKRCF
jgi:hypothetical protein